MKRKGERPSSWKANESGEKQRKNHSEGMCRFDISFFQVVNHTMHSVKLFESGMGNLPQNPGHVGASMKCSYGVRVDVKRERRGGDADAENEAGLPDSESASIPA